MEPKEILEKIVELSNSFESLYVGVPINGTKKISLGSMDHNDIHILSGINVLADACGQELLKDSLLCDDKLDQYYYFDYCGKHFFQFDTDPPEKMA